MKRFSSWFLELSPLGPIYDRYWRRRLALISIVSLSMPFGVVVAGLTASDGEATAASMAFGGVLIYSITVVVSLVLAIALMPRGMKEEWRHRQFKARVPRSQRR
jgi:MFS family permease